MSGELTAPALQPLPGFDWSKVKWGGPRQARTLTCSYCQAPLDEDDMPLIMWTQAGYCAEFCEQCQVRWWGMSGRRDDEIDDEIDL